MPVYHNFSDNELIAFLREGNTAACTEIYDRYFQLMFVFAYKKLRDEELAKDFVQELFIKLWERRERLGEVVNLSSYLYVTMRNKILDYFSHEKVASKYIAHLGCYLSRNQMPEADYLVREKQLAAYIESQVQALPQKMRRIFELSRKEYLSHKEISVVLDTSENNVSTQVMNALRILKTKLKVLSMLMIG